MCEDCSRRGNREWRLVDANTALYVDAQTTVCTGRSEHAHHLTCFIWIVCKDEVIFASVFAATRTFFGEWSATADLADTVGNVMFRGHREKKFIAKRILFVRSH